MKKLLLVILLLISCNVAQATVTPRPVGGDARIKIINYKPNTVFEYVGHYEYDTILEFAEDETIETITMGYPAPWQIVPAGNRIFIKPIDDNATTNMTIITNKRMYFFEMRAEEATDINDESLSFVVKFIYPEQYQASSIQNVPTKHGPDLSKPELYNFDYTIAGDAKYIEPLQIFDDGEFTYFRFRDINSEIPAIFKVNSDGSEALVNFRFQAGYAIVEMVWDKFTLRHGGDTLCVYNKNIEATTKSKKARTTIF